MAEGEETEAQELAMLIRRLDRQRRAKLAADAISEQATGVLYDKQQHIRLVQAVAVAANESTSLDEALQTAVDQICTHFGWPLGHAYLAIGSTAILTLSDIWFVEDLSRYGAFRRAVETTLVAPTEGLAGRALSTRDTVVDPDICSSLPPALAGAAADAGFRSGLALPVISFDTPLAVLEFFALDPIDEDDVRDAISRIGDLLGKVHVRTRAEATLQSSEEQYRLVFDENPHAMWIHDTSTLQIIAVNDAAVRQLGRPRRELLRMTVTQLQAPHIADTTAPREGVTHLIRGDGTLLPVEMTGYEVAIPGRQARIVMAVDVDESRRTADALRESERRFREMLDTIELTAVLLDVIGTVTYCNPYMLKITGYTKDEVVGHNFFERFLPGYNEEEGRNFASAVGRGVVAAHHEMEISTRLGEKRVILWNNTLLRNPHGSILGIAAIGSDVTEQRAAESQLLHNAFHDSLTGLPNRALFLDRVGHALNRVKRDGRQKFAVLFLDIDHFKNVNDSLGHAAGDALLIEIGNRLARGVRAADTVARFGGDEFTILVERVIDATDATRTAVRVQDEIAAPYRVGETDLFVSCSIGIAIGGDSYETAEQILRDADTAMYRAKAQGRSRSEIFDANMRAEVVSRLQLETDLRRAIERDELRVFYQPIVKLDSAEVIGFEALVRWQHPRRGLVGPVEFIPLAEETGLIVPIGQFVFGESCRQAALWNTEMSVNFSARHFGQADLVSDVRSALESCQASPSSIHIEVTESAIMQQPDEAMKLMTQLRESGCRIALDDFGTGFSSLSYLHRFPIDRLKIDASFVRNLSVEHKNVEIIRSIIALGDALEIEVVAEGIETEEQRQLLIDLGCKLGQGYLFARPADALTARSLLPA